MIRAKKSLGQNFLIDQKIINRMVNILELKNKNILEIGPGTGNLTNGILTKNPKIGRILLNLPIFPLSPCLGSLGLLSFSLSGTDDSSSRRCLNQRYHPVAAMLFYAIIP